MVGVAERHPAGDEFQRAVGGEDARIGERGAQAVRMDGKAADEAREDPERRARRVERLHDDLLRVLKVAIVAAGHAEQNAVRRRGKAADLRGLRADELADVRIVLLRHD